VGTFGKRTGALCCCCRWLMFDLPGTQITRQQHQFVSFGLGISHKIGGGTAIPCPGTVCLTARVSKNNNRLFVPRGTDIANKHELFLVGVAAPGDNDHRIRFTPANQSLSRRCRGTTVHCRVSSLVVAVPFYHKLGHLRAKGFSGIRVLFNNKDISSVIGGILVFSQWMTSADRLLGTVTQRRRRRHTGYIFCCVFGYIFFLFFLVADEVMERSTSSE